MITIEDTRVYGLAIRKIRKLNYAWYKGYITLVIIQTFQE